VLFAEDAPRKRTLRSIDFVHEFRASDTRTRAATSPGSDARAADRLDYLRERAIWPGYSLWEIHAIEWASAAGQRAVCVDVLVGQMRRLWLEQVCLDRGTFIFVVVEDDGRHTLVDWIDVRAVASASRHRRKDAVCARRRAAKLHCASARLERSQAGRLIREVESVLRQN
jgi:hypothetical protein